MRPCWLRRALSTTTGTIEFPRIPKRCQCRDCGTDLRIWGEAAPRLCCDCYCKRIEDGDYTWRLETSSSSTEARRPEVLSPIIEARPLCGCSCRCPHRPGRRIICPGCNHQVCPKYCWVDGPLCHLCLRRPPPPEPPAPEPDPEPRQPRVIIEDLESDEAPYASFPVGIGNN